MKLGTARVNGGQRVGAAVGDPGERAVLLDTGSPLAGPIEVTISGTGTPSNRLETR